MFYNEETTINQIEEDPSLVFKLIREGHTDFVDLLISKGKIDINTKDERGNNLLTKLLKVGRYDIVSKYMLMKDFDINNQNEDGNTFAHILVTINYVNVVDLINKLKKNKNFIPNIKNNNGETILDKSINNNYIYTSMKIIEDVRFNNIDILSFKNLYNSCIKNKKYGKYSKVTNLETIVENLDKKKLLPRMEELVNMLKTNLDSIINELMNNNLNVIDEIINTCTVESI